MSDPPKLRLVAENVRCYEWEAFDKCARREPKPPRERLGPVRSKTRGRDPLAEVVE
jgi:hypothetical protein